MCTSSGTVWACALEALPPKAGSIWSSSSDSTSSTRGNPHVAQDIILAERSNIVSGFYNEEEDAKQYARSPKMENTGCDCEQNRPAAHWVPVFRGNLRTLTCIDARISGDHT